MKLIARAVIGRLALLDEGLRFWVQTQVGCERARDDRKPAERDAAQEQMARIDSDSKMLATLADGAHPLGECSEVLGQALEEAATVQALADHEAHKTRSG